MFGTDQHAYVADTFNNMASVYLKQGSLTKALEFYEKALTIYQKVFGTDQHADVANTFFNMGLLYKNQGDKVKAKELFTKCAEIYEAVIGPEFEWAKRARDILKTL